MPSEGGKTFDTTLHWLSGRALLTCVEDGLICSVLDLKTCPICDSSEVYM